MKSRTAVFIFVVIAICCLAVLTTAVWGLCMAGLALWQSIIIVSAASAGITVMVIAVIVWFAFSDCD